MGFRSKISSTPANPAEPRHGGTILIEGIPMTTKLEFKAACALVRRPMRDVFIDFMRNFVTTTTDKYVKSSGTEIGDNAPQLKTVPGSVLQKRARRRPRRASR